MIEVLNTVRVQWQNISLSFSKFFILTAALDFLVFMISLTCFHFLIGCILIYTPCVRELRLCAFNDILITYINVEIDLC